MNITNVERLQSAFEKDMESLWDAYTERAEQKARTVFQVIVKPFCKEKKLRFLAGNGTWAFFAKNEPAYCPERPFEDTEEWDALMALLTMEVPGMPGNDLGSLMPSCKDYTYEED